LSERPLRPNKARPGLLVSLVAVSECSVFTAAGYPDFIDVKNPAAGSLGMPDLNTIKEIRKTIPLTVPVSAAIGDAHDDPLYYASLASMAIEAGADIVKVGLYGFSNSKRIHAFLSHIRRENAGVPLAACFYADLVDSRSVRDFPSVAADAGADICLLDTFSKTGEKLTDYIGKDELSFFTGLCGRFGLLSAFAGGLGVEDADWIAQTAPDIAGFRGAVAENGRGETGISPAKLKKLITVFNSLKPSLAVESCIG
jgi:uncharacterized protein (UPF0264 family)